MRTYRGSCHCGRVRFEVEAELDPVRCLEDVDLDAIPVRRVHGSRLP